MNQEMWIVWIWLFQWRTNYRFFILKIFINYNLYQIKYEIEFANAES